MKRARPRKLVAIRTCINFWSCEFHQTNNLEKIYTDETSMAAFATKEHV
ncbi:hypothetical protein [Thermophagus xiamenensis]|nr:hypothetical protein [Thermophagus xiamenensis]